jgi:enterochelin esterase-like enzyme
MKYLNIVFVLIFVACTPASDRSPSSQGLVVAENKAGTTPYWILKPEGEFFVALPVVYFLSGKEGHLFFRDLDGVKAMKEYFAKGGTPFVIVGLGDAQDKKTRFNEVISQIEAQYSIGGDNNRLVAGIANGAILAEHLALTSDLFKCVALHSPLPANKDLRSKFDKKFLDVTGEFPEGTEVESYWKQKLPGHIKWYGECFL